MQIGIECGETFGEFIGEARHLPFLLHVHVPAAEINARDFQTQIGFDQLRDRHQRFTVRRVGILRSTRRRVISRKFRKVVDRLQGLPTIRFDESVAVVQRGERSLNLLRFARIAL